MVLLVFLIDTSASMNQRTCLGTTYLDLAKGAVESFLKIRARDTNVSRGDRYMLVTYDEESKSVKAGWRENLVTFMKELKNLEGNVLSNMGRALKDTFDLLNMHRLQSGIDNYGMGRNPYYLEPALILLLSDGCAMMDIGGIIPEITLPTHNMLPGGELTKELYRWDQRLFTLNMKIPGLASSVSENLPVLLSEDMPLGNMCEQTGGKLYNVVSQKSLMQAMESIAQKILIPGVTISFEKYGVDPEPIPKEGLNVELEREKGEKENTAPSSEPAVLTNHDSMSPVMNGFIPPHYMDAKLTNGPFQNNMSLPNDVGKVPNGLINAAGLLPSPLMMPLVPPIPLPGRGMMPGSPMRGMLPPGYPPGLLRPPIPYSPQNRLVPPPTNDMPNIVPLVNGKADESEMIGMVEPKSEGECTKGSKIPDIPIRGDENSLDFNGNVDTPTVSNVSTNWQSQRRAIYVRTNVKGTVGHWPIPESFWPDSSLTKLPPRTCHPVVNFKCASTEAMAIDNMPFDKYELEPSPLTQYILERKQPNVAWQTFVSGSSHDSELGYPFGYLKASTNLQCVNFFVLPYNYTLIMPLLDELFKIHKCKPTVKWRQSFEDYLKTIPSYYSAPLRNALRRMGAPNNLIPDHMDGSMSYSVVSYLKKVKHQAKLEAERLTNLHSHPHCPDPVQINVPLSPSFSDGKQNDFKQLLIQKSTAMLNKELVSKDSDGHKKSETDVFEKFSDTGIPLLVDKFQVRSYKNPFDIHRGDLLQQSKRMRTNFFHIDTVCNRLHEEDSKHRVSIAQMGNYQDHAMQFKPLREVDPSQARVHTFGNPFKLKQDQIIAVDEADVNDSMAFGNNSRKRPGEQSPLLQRNKKKRSDTPPPSRRPLGPPNTPPPKIESPSIETMPLQSDKGEDTNNFTKTSENCTEHPEYNDIGKDINSQCDGHMKLTDLKDLSRTNNSTINQQLRRLQQLHKNTKELGDRNLEVFNENFDEINDDLNSSPIMSILRTSLEEIDDKENEELVMINDNDSSKTRSSHRNNDTSSNHSLSMVVSNTSKKSPISNKMLKELPFSVTQKARLELQTLSSSKIRLAVWQAIRNRSDNRGIFDLIDQLAVSAVAKTLFITDVIAEAGRFQLSNLTEKLRGLVEPDEPVMER